MALIGAVALIVIGPEKLPRVARTVGTLLGKAQRYVNDVKADISREVELDELRKLQASMQDAARSLENSVSREVNETESELKKITDDASSAVEPPQPDAPPRSEASNQLELGLDTSPRPSESKSG